MPPVVLTRESIREVLTPGRRLEPGRVCEVVVLVAERPRRLEELVECLWDDDAGIAGRAADALERATRQGAARVERWKDELLGLMAETAEKKVRWNLALTIPRLTLSLMDCSRAAATLGTYLDDPSSIVKTMALHGLADLTRQNRESLPEVLDMLRVAGRSGTPAMRARSRILLKRLENPTRNQRGRNSLHIFG